MPVTVEYACGATGLGSVTCSLFDDAAGDAAAAVTLTLVEGTYRTGYYTASSSALVPAHLYWGRISGARVDSVFAVAPSSGKMKLIPLCAIDWASMINASVMAEAILANPANKLVTNPDGSVNINSSSAIQNNITIPAAVAQASQSPAQITCLRGDTLSVALPLMGNITTRSRLIVTVKLNLNDADDAAVFQIIEGSGLAVFNGAPATMNSAASLTVTNAATGAVVLAIDASVTCQLAVEDLVWDAQVTLENGIVTPISGLFTVVGDVTRTVT